jgi:hypothetical protein
MISIAIVNTLLFSATNIDGSQATHTTEDDTEIEIDAPSSTKENMTETTGLNSDLTVKNAGKKKALTAAKSLKTTTGLNSDLTVKNAGKKKAQTAAKSLKTAPTVNKLTKTTKTVDSSADKMVTRSSGRSK